MSNPTPPSPQPYIGETSVHAKKSPLEGKSTINYMGHTLYTEQGVQERIAEDRKAQAQAGAVPAAAPDDPQKSDAEAVGAAPTADVQAVELPLVDQYQNLAMRKVSEFNNNLLIDFEFMNWEGGVEVEILNEETQSQVLERKLQKQLNQPLVIVEHDLAPGEYRLAIREWSLAFTI